MGVSKKGVGTYDRKIGDKQCFRTANALGSLLIPMHCTGKNNWSGAVERKGKSYLTTLPLSALTSQRGGNGKSEKR